MNIQEIREGGTQVSIITLNHGNGGKGTSELLHNIFYKYFKNEVLLKQGDSSIIDSINGKLAVTTDSYVIDPIFFPGGDIGKLSICGTVNDLAVSGAKPLYITAGFIIEEGLSMEDLESVVQSMADTAAKCKVKIIAGDTKVVPKGKGDKLYINTAGVGVLNDDRDLRDKYICEGDKIIVSGTMGEHGIAIFCKREGMCFETNIKSDCNPLNFLIDEVLKEKVNVKFIRDITRGGLATILNEISHEKNKSIIINERDIPIREDVMATCEILGFDPLYIANEGKVLIVVSKEDCNKVLEIMKNNPLGKDAAIIGEFIEESNEKVYLKTKYNGTRVLSMLEEELIPRIC